MIYCQVGKNPPTFSTITGNSLLSSQVGFGFPGRVPIADVLKIHFILSFTSIWLIPNTIPDIGIFWVWKISLFFMETFTGFISCYDVLIPRKLNSQLLFPKTLSPNPVCVIDQHRKARFPNRTIPAGCAQLLVSGEHIGPKGSLSDLVLIKQLPQKNSHPPQVLSYMKLPWPAWQVLSKCGADLQTATSQVGLTPGWRLAVGWYRGPYTHCDSGQMDQGVHRLYALIP